MLAFAFLLLTTTGLPFYFLVLLLETKNESVEMIYMREEITQAR